MNKSWFDSKYERDSKPLFIHSMDKFQHELNGKSRISSHEYHWLLPGNLKSLN